MKKALDIINGLSLDEIFKKMVLDLKYTIFIMKNMLKDQDKERILFRNVLVKEIGKEPPGIRKKIIDRLNSATACLKEV